MAKVTQTKTCNVSVNVENTLTIMGDSALNLKAGEEGCTTAYTLSGGSGNVLTASTEATGLTVSITDNKLYASDDAPEKNLTVTLTVTSLGGQTVTKDVTVNVYNQLVFTSVPTGGAIIYAV